MEQKSTPTILSLFIRKGLGRSLLFIFLVTALMPLTAVSIIHYQTSREFLVDTTERNLKEVAESEAAELRNYYNRMVANLLMLSQMRQNISFLRKLTDSFQKSKMDLHSFTESSQWKMLAERGHDLSLIQRTLGVHDILLLDNRGNILYTVIREDDLGTNPLAAPNNSSPLAVSCQKTLATGKPAFGDYSIYPVSATNNGYAFLTAPIQTDSGETLGIIALQLSGSDIDTMLQGTLGERGETYLISNKTRLSTSRLDPSKKLLSPVKETAQVLNWRNQWQEIDNQDKKHFQSVHSIQTYMGPHGALVYGTLRSLHVADTPLAVIAEVEESQTNTLLAKLRQTVLLLALLTGLVAIILISFYARGLVWPILELVDMTRRVASGDYEEKKVIRARFELGTLIENFNTMRLSLQETADRENLDKWNKIGLAGLNDILRGEQELDELAGGVSSYFARYLNAQVGACFVRQKKEYVFSGGFAYTVRDPKANRYSPSEGLVGQAAHDQKTIHYKQLPGDHLPVTINSGLSESAPVAVIALPLVYEGKTLGVLELGRISEFTQNEISLLEEGAHDIAIVLNTARTRQHTNELLLETQRQSEELQMQQEELKTANEELEEQTAELRKSQQQLQEQSEELKASNEELEEKTLRLEEQKLLISQAKVEVEQQATALASASRYKSEFLANMSHELRSPLNSLLILARSLADNEEGNLTSEQTEEAEIIHNSGTELLHLINDILDLSKVEAGQLDVHTDEFAIQPFCQGLRSAFAAQATEKGLTVRLHIDDSLPPVIISDEQRLGQILKNLLSNALKFTSQGEVVFTIRPEGANKIAFIVSDTGIGIASDKQQAIFEAFQQADGSTTRKYGGTGLGLTISRQLADLLGGSLGVESEPGEGTTFTLLLPLQAGDADLFTQTTRTLPSDSRNELSESASQELTRQNLIGKKVLIVDDDMRNTFAIGNLLKKVGMVPVLAADGNQCLERLGENPDVDLILMDIIMPNLDGFETMKQLRSMDKFKNLPVIAITAKAMDGDREQCLESGTNGYLSKPIEKDKLLKLIDEILSNKS